MIEDYLEIQLAHSECSTETNCPVYVPQLGVDELHKFAEQAAKHSEQIGKLGRYYFFVFYIFRFKLVNLGFENIGIILSFLRFPNLKAY